MDRKETIEIPFGAFDSELKGWEYTIPEGMKARIEGNKIILEPKESENERIRKMLIEQMERWHECALEDNVIQDIKDSADAITWLEKQGSQNLANSAKTCKDGQNPAWSEEDIKTIERIVCILDGIRYYNTVDNKQEKPYQSEVDFLKSLKERYTWKPSDEHTSKDAFIEKALSWLKNHYRDYMYNPTGKNLEAFFGIDMCNDFENYIKEE